MILSISTMSEHLSDIAAIGAVTGKDYYADPGVHRTLIADGIGNMISGLLGNPVSSTTYGENTGWCNLSKEFSTKNQLTAGIFLILLSFLGYFSAFLGSIPWVVIGAVSLVLYGMIAAAGLSLLVRNQIDFNIPRNLVIASIVLSLAIGGFVLKIGDFTLSSIACGTIVGVILNLIIPEKKIIS
jgi:uracil permease